MIKKFTLITTLLVLVCAFTADAFLRPLRTREEASDPTAQTGIGRFYGKTDGRAYYISGSGTTYDLTESATAAAGSGVSWQGADNDVVASGETTWYIGGTNITTSVQTGVTVTINSDLGSATIAGVTLDWNSGNTLPVLQLIARSSTGTSDYFIATNSSGTAYLVAPHSALEALDADFVAADSILYVSGTGQINRLSLAGSAGLFLEGQGAGSAPQWSAAAGGGTGGTGATTFRDQDGDEAVAATIDDAEYGLFVIGTQGLKGDNFTGNTIYITGTGLHSQVTEFFWTQIGTLLARSGFSGDTAFGVASQTTEYVANAITTATNASAIGGTSIAQNTITDDLVDWTTGVTLPSVYAITSGTSGWMPAVSSANTLYLIGPQSVADSMNVLTRANLSAAGAANTTTGTSIVQSAVTDELVDWTTGVTLPMLYGITDSLSGESDYFIVVNSGGTLTVVDPLSALEALDDSLDDTDVVYYGSSGGNISAVALGAAGTYLKSQGAGSPITFDTPSGNVQSGQSGYWPAYTGTDQVGPGPYVIYTTGSSTYFKDSQTGTTYMEIGPVGLQLNIATITGITIPVMHNPTSGSGNTLQCLSATSGEVLAVCEDLSIRPVTNTATLVSHSLASHSDTDTYLGTGAVAGVSLAEHHPTWAEHTAALDANAFRTSTGGTNFAVASETTVYITTTITSYTSHDDFAGISDFAVDSQVTEHVATVLTTATDANAITGVSIASATIPSGDIGWQTGVTLPILAAIAHSPSGVSSQFAATASSGNSLYLLDPVSALGALDSALVTANSILYVDQNSNISVLALDGPSTDKYLKSQGANQTPTWDTPVGGTGGSGITHFVVTRLDDTQDDIQITGNSLYFKSEAGVSLSMVPSSGSQTGATIYIGSEVTAWEKDDANQRIILNDWQGRDVMYVDNVDEAIWFIKPTTGASRMRIDSEGVTQFYMHVHAANGANPGSFRIYEASNNGGDRIVVKAPADITSNYDFILPRTAGVSNQVLATDAAGKLSFCAVGDLSHNQWYIPEDSPEIVNLAYDLLRKLDTIYVVGRRARSLVFEEIGEKAVCVDVCAIDGAGVTVRSPESILFLDDMSQQVVLDSGVLGASITIESFNHAGRKFYRAKR